MTHRVVRLGEGSEDAEHRVGHHDQQRQHPGGRDDAVGVGSGLPRAGLQRVADGAVSFNGDGHEAEGGDADGDPWKSNEKCGTNLHTTPSPFFFSYTGDLIPPPPLCFGSRTGEFLQT